jgi:hypothetical protein
VAQSYSLNYFFASQEVAMAIRNAYVKIEANLGYSPVEPDDHVSRAQKAIAETPPT